MSLRIVATGGTFDKRYDPVAGTLGFGGTHLHDVVRRARIAPPVVVEAPLQLDSLDMTDADRARVVHACIAAPESRIVVVHGTDTMVETAAAIATAGLGKTVVLTGAMVPYDLAESDALFNLGFAVACARTLAPGVWIAMNGQAHRWDRVRKNRALGVFEPVADGASTP